MTRAEIATILLEMRSLDDRGRPVDVVVETAAGHMLSITGVRQLGNGIIALRVTWGDEPR